MIPLTPADKESLGNELINPLDNPFLTALIRNIIHQSTTLADVHPELVEGSITACRLLPRRLRQQMGR